MLAPAQQQIAQPTSESNHQDIVDGRVVRVGNPLDERKVATNKCEPAVPANALVQACLRRPRFDESLMHCRPGLLGLMDGFHRMGDLADSASGCLYAPADVVLK